MRAKVKRRAAENERGAEWLVKSERGKRDGDDN